MDSKEQNRDTNFESRANQMRMMRNKVKGNRNVAKLEGFDGNIEGAEVFIDQCVQAQPIMVDTEVSN